MSKILLFFVLLSITSRYLKIEEVKKLLSNFRLAKFSESCVKLAKDLPNAEGSVLYTPTWRASPDWGERMSMTKEEVKSTIILIIILYYIIVIITSYCTSTSMCR